MLWECCRIGSVELDHLLILRHFRPALCLARELYNLISSSDSVIRNCYFILEMSINYQFQSCSIGLGISIAKRH